MCPEPFVIGGMAAFLRLDAPFIAAETTIWRLAPMVFRHNASDRRFRAILLG
jgi:hypothetical protein